MTTAEIQTLRADSASTNVTDYTKAMLNILEDFSEEKGRLEDTQRATLNILDDFAMEKARLEETQRAMLNLLEDFDVERTKTEAANRELSANEERLRLTLNEKENLLKEIHHRIKNNLHIIHSMLNLQMSYIHDKQTIEMFKDSRDRVYSMALIHEKLYQSESLAKIDLPEYIRSLISNLFISYGLSERVVRPKIDVEDAALDIDTLIPCALIITELVSNSLKHAFPGLPGRSDMTGEIRIELRHDTDNKFMLRVGDNGIGMPKDFDIQNSRSLGLKLVYVLVKQLKGTIQHGRGGKGTEFTITFNVLRKM
ncbi:MAG: histidine kinase dimerization/phosphoacceptor domain -containing protein [Candidatus Methanoperedens sp.]